MNLYGQSNRREHSSCPLCGESNFTDELANLFADDSFAAIDKFRDNLEGILRVILDRLVCFEDIYLLKEIEEDTGLYKIVANCNKQRKDFPYKRDKFYLPDDLLSFEISSLDPFFSKKKPKQNFEDNESIDIPTYYFKYAKRIGKNLYFISSENEDMLSKSLKKLSGYEIHTGYLTKIKLRSKRNLLLIQCCPPHKCDNPDSPPCVQQTDKCRTFMQDLSDKISREFETVFYLKNVLNERERQIEFLDIVAHALSIPIESALIDSSNILESLPISDPNRKLCLHLFNEIKVLELDLQNILHSSSQTIQPKPKFEYRSLLLLLKEAIEIFKGEATHKGCDIKLCLKVNGVLKEIDLSDLLDDFLLAKRILYANLSDELGYGGSYLSKKEVGTYINRRGKCSEIDPGTLPRECFNLNKSNYSSQDTFVDIVIKGEKIKKTVEFVANAHFPLMSMAYRELLLAFKNLIQNAVKYSFKTVPTSKRRFISVDVEAKDGVYLIDISNYGVGIEQYELEKDLIWRPRYRGIQSRDKNRTGAGLGLAIAKKYIEEINGGTIHAESKPISADGPYINVFHVELLIDRWF